MSSAFNDVSLTINNRKSLYQAFEGMLLERYEISAQKYVNQQQDGILPSSRREISFNYEASWNEDNRHRNDTITAIIW